MNIEGIKSKAKRLYRNLNTFTRTWLGAALVFTAGYYTSEKIHLWGWEKLADGDYTILRVLLAVSIVVHFNWLVDAYKTTIKIKDEEERRRFAEWVYYYFIMFLGQILIFWLC